MRERWDTWDQKQEPGVSISRKFHKGCPANLNVTIAPLYVAPDLKWRYSMERQERLTTASAGSTLGVSKSCTAIWHPHPGAHLPWGSSTWGTGLFQGRRTDQPTAEWWQNRTPTCRGNRNKSLRPKCQWLSPVSFLIPLHMLHHGAQLSKGSPWTSSITIFRNANSQKPCMYSPVIYVLRCPAITWNVC